MGRKFQTLENILLVLSAQGAERRWSTEEGAKLV
jgi:hypothetical protein